MSIVKALATGHHGMTRNEISKTSKLANGGGLTRILEELEASSFILPILPFGKKKKDTLYRLVDEYSLFYLKFIDGQQAGHKNIWLQKSNEQVSRIWQGYAFENICIKHSEAIKKALGIDGMYSSVHSYFAKNIGDYKGLQIDLLIDRADRALNLCEMKFYDSEFTLTASMAMEWRQKRALFKERTGTRKAIFNTLITTYGLIANSNSLAQVDQTVTMHALFDQQRF